MPATKDKKRNTWTAQFYYTDWTGKKVKKCKRGFETKKLGETFPFGKVSQPGYDI